MYGAGIEVTDEDFEFAKPPLSKKFIRLVFEKYQLDYIAYFGKICSMSQGKTPSLLLHYIPIPDILRILNWF